MQCRHHGHVRLERVRPLRSSQRHHAPRACAEQQPDRPRVRACVSCLLQRVSGASEKVVTCHDCHYRACRSCGAAPPADDKASRRCSARTAGAAGAAAMSLALALGGPGPACAAALRQLELPPIPTVFPPLPDLKAPKLEEVVLANGVVAWPACAARTWHLAPHGRPANEAARLLQVCGCS